MENKLNIDTRIYSYEKGDRLLLYGRIHFFFYYLLYNTCLRVNKSDIPLRLRKVLLARFRSSDRSRRSFKYANDIAYQSVLLLRELNFCNYVQSLEHNGSIVDVETNEDFAAAKARRS